MTASSPSPQEAIERVRERGDVITWTDSGHTFLVKHPEAVDIVFDFAVERWHAGECYPWGMIDPLSLWNVLNSRDFRVRSEREAMRRVHGDD